MRKRIFTSFLVLAAVVLFAVPTQAQTALKASKAQSGQVIKGNKAVKSTDLQKAKAAMAREALKAERDAELTAPVEKVAEQGYTPAAWVANATQWAHAQSPILKSVQTSYNKQKPVLSGAEAFNANNLLSVSAVTREHNAVRKNAPRHSLGLVTPPASAESETYYTSAGKFYLYGSNGWEDQTSAMKSIEVIVDGTDIYIAGLAYYVTDAWIKGTLSGTTATFPASQQIDDDADYPEWISGSSDGQTVSDIVFEFDQEAGTLTSTTNYIGECAVESTFSLYGYWTKPTFSKNYDGPQVVELPAGVELVEYSLTYETSSGSTGSGAAAVAVDGNDVYFKGFSTYLPDALIKGTKSGNTITFPANQYLGSYAGYDSYLYVEATFTYDAATDTYSSTDHVYSVLGGKYYDANYFNPVLKGVVEKAATPANPAITALTDSQYGYYIVFNVPNVDTDGDGLVASKLFYEIYTDTEHDVQPLTFTSATHSKLTEDLTIIPFGFTEGYDFYDTQIYLNDLYSADWNKIGIKSIYTGGGETNETEIQWFDIKDYSSTDDPDDPTDPDDPSDVITAPVTLDLTQAGALDDFGVIDNNNDGTTWSWSAANGVYYSWSTANDADDYLILPIKLEANKNYNVIVTASSYSSSYPEKFEVKVGKAGTVEALTTTAIAETTVASNVDADFDGSFTTDEAGTYYVAIHATSDKNQWRLNVKKLVIEAGAEGNAPAAVENLTVTPFDEDVLGATVAFTAPSKAIDGSALASDGITKIEILRDGNVINTITAPAPGSAQSYADNGADLTIGNHKYQVIPYGASGIGEKSEEITVFLSATLTVPYIADFTKAGTFDAFQVIDNNGDDKTWNWSATAFAYYSYSSTEDADDYLVTSPIKLEAGKSYKATVAAHSYNASYPEKLEVVVGKEATAAGLSQTVIPATTVATGTAEDFEGEFSVAETGVYYVAVHAISDKDQWSLTVEKLSIEKGAEPTAPAATELTATAGAEGALEVNLAFTVPATAVNGSALSGTEDVKIYRDDAVIATLSGVTAGSAQTYKDTDVEDGQTYTYYVVASNASGDGQKSQKVSVYVGQDELGDVQNFAITGNTANSITFAWDEATGKNGGYVNTANAEYTIYELVVKSNGYWNYLEIVDDIATVSGATTATVQYPVDEGTQGYQYFGISVKTTADNETDATAAYTWLIVGAPEDLPIEEGFTGKTLHYNWSSNGGLYISTDATDGDDVALKLTSENGNETIYFQLDKVNVNTAQNPTLLFDVTSSNINSVRVIGSKDGADTETLATESVSGEYKTVKVPLTSLQNGRYATVGFEADFVESSYVGQYSADWGDTLVVDNIKIIDFYEYNLAASVSAPKSVKAGDKATITATVKNTGENAAKDYTVTIKAGDKELLSETVSEELASFASKEFTAEFETSIFDDAADVTITAEVSYANDLNEDDDVAETVISIKEPSAAQPENLTAEDKGDEGVVLNWTAPDNATQEVKEDFDAYENGADEDGELGDWTLVNANGHTKGGIFEDLELASDGLVRAWQVFNLATYGGDNTAFAGPDGEVDNNYLVSIYNLENESYPGNDDWLISPALPGIAQTITLDVKAFNDYGAQTYQVLYSTTDTNTESFQLIEEVSDNGNEWNNVSYDLPAGTKYFAIRNITGGDEGFILAVDNINFLVGGGNVTGYNIYYEGELIATVEGGVTTYTVAADQIEAGEKTFAVSALYGETESKPVEVTVNVTTAIQNIVVNENAPADVYTLDGKLVRQQATSLNGLQGVFVVNGKAVILK